MLIIFLLALIAQIPMQTEILEQVYQSLVDVGKQNAWHIRSATLPFLQYLDFFKTD